MDTGPRPGEISDLSNLPGDSRWVAPRAFVKLPTLLLGVLLISGCVAAPVVDLNATSERRPASVAAELDPCNPVNITTVIAKRLRVGVTEPFAEPYLFNAGPLGVQGYQADVVYAIAATFALRPNEVVWLDVPPDADPVEAEVDFLLSRVGSRADLQYSPVYGPDSLALAFAPANPFAACVAVAIEELAGADELRQIEQNWLTTRG